MVELYVAFHAEAGDENVDDDAVADDAEHEYERVEDVEGVLDVAYVVLNEEVEAGRLV